MSEANVQIHGHLTLRAIHADGREEVLHEERNQVTYAYLDVLVELIGQRSTFADPLHNSVHSMWFEGSAADIPDPTAADITYGPGVTIMDQVVIADADRDRSVVADARVLTVRADLGSGTGNGQTLRAVGLYTRGISSTPPTPAGFVTGTDGVSLIARQKTPPIIKGTFVVQATWQLYYAIVP